MIPLILYVGFTTLSHYKTRESSTRHSLFIRTRFVDVFGPVVQKTSPLSTKPGRKRSYVWSLHIDSIIQDKNRRDSSSRLIEHT